MSVVINSTNRSICLYCNVCSEDTDADKEFHDIFDEIGLELPLLVKRFFGITVQNNGRFKQLLCDDCVNRLIELYDLDEHCKEKGTVEATGTTGAILENKADLQIAKTGDAETAQSNNPDDIIDDINYIDSPSDNGSQNRQTSDLTKIEVSVVQRENAEINFSVDDETLVSKHFDNQQDYDEDIIEKSDMLCGELEFIDEEDLQGFSQDSEQYIKDGDDDIPQISSHNVENVTAVITSTTANNRQCLKDDGNDHITESESASQKTENDAYEEVTEFQFDALDNEYLEVDKPSSSNTADEEVFDETTQETLKDAMAEEIEDSMDVIDENDDDIEEEYLIEETLCAQEYDNIDLNEYLDSAIVTNFEDLELNWPVECKLCFYKHYTFQELIKHPCINELVGEEESMECCCIINECNDVVTSLKQLARHLVIKHYNSVESVIIYGRCPDCQKPFSSIVDFNKHSCCNIKRKAGSRNYCQACNLDFQSLKRYVFHMQFHLAKHRPKICLLCGATFNNADDFFDHVHYSHEPDTALACIKCDRFFQEKSVFEQHMACHDSKYTFECTHCPKTYTNRSGLTSHMDIYHNHEMKPLQCEYCYKEFVNQSSYRSHIKAHMPEAKVPAYICSLCGLVSNNDEFIRTHLETDEASALDATAEVIEKIISVAYTCESCSMDFFSARYLHQHRQSSRHNEKLFHCPICHKAFKTLKHMRNHLTSHKDYDDWLSEFPISRLYMCNIGDCHDAYPLWTTLYYHKKRHKNTPLSADQLKCQFCEKACSTKMSLAIHVARVHNNNNVKCQYCTKSYKNEKDLERHTQYMHVSVQCSKCYKVFKNRRNLTSHEQLVHKNEKRYFCSICGKGYYYKSEMQAHEKNVHPDTTYKCHLCNFVTNYPKSLEIHNMAKHTEDLPFKCASCSKGFARKQLLNLHMRRHKEDKDFICYEYCEDGCNASFITHFLLRKHIASKHPKNEKETRPAKKRKLNAKDNDTAGGDMRRLLIIEDDAGDVELVLGADGNELGSDDEYELHYEHNDEDDDGEEDEIVDDLEDIEQAEYDDDQ